MYVAIAAGNSAAPAVYNLLKWLKI